jgi:hypothetical protein
MFENIFNIHPLQIETLKASDLICGGGGDTGGTVTHSS